MRLGKVTLGGLLLAATGWGFMITYPLLFQSEQMSLTTILTQGGNTFVMRVAENVIATGFVVALLGAMSSFVQQFVYMQRQTLMSAGQGRAQHAGPGNTAFQHGGAFAGAEAVAAPEAPEVVGTGDLSGRDYLMYSDGTVEVETLLGRRKFQTLEDAQSFIGD